MYSPKQLVNQIVLALAVFDCHYKSQTSSNASQVELIYEEV
jgi:hypothetical protein